jgi:hypothetical protein
MNNAAEILEGLRAPKINITLWGEKAAAAQAWIRMRVRSPCTPALYSEG